MTQHQTEGRISPPEPIGPNIAAQWMLDPNIAFLNHGSFGARLKSVWAIQQRWREQLEARPIEFLDRRGPELLTAAKDRIGAFLGMKTDDFGFVTNATEAVNAVVQSIRFESGDEVIATTHTYPAMRHTLRHMAEQCGAIYREIAYAEPVRNDQQIIALFDEAVSERTTFVLVDHITSPSAIRLPIESIIELCRQRGADIFIDGAHAPGMIDLDVQSLGATYYTGNLHKWVCAPPGAGFLWVDPIRQPMIHPAVISNFYGDGFVREFLWQGSRDTTPWLTAANAIDEMEKLAPEGGWDAIRAHNHRMAVWAHQLLGDIAGLEALTPMDGSMLGSMCSFRLPETVRNAYETPVAFQTAIRDRGRIEIPIFPDDQGWCVRPSCQVYNVAEHYERLAETLNALMHGA